GTLPKQQILLDLARLHPPHLLLCSSQGSSPSGPSTRSESPSSSPLSSSSTSVSSSSWTSSRALPNAPPRSRFSFLAAVLTPSLVGTPKGDGLGAEIIGTFVLVYTVFSATDAKRSARDSHIPVIN
ncbi:unnamed protein product, partial [Linum tenue]